MAAEKDTGTSQLLREAEDAASFITSHIQNFTTPKVAIVCGSGLSTLADSLIDPVSIPYSEIPHFVVSSVAGHSSRLVYGLLGPERIPTLAMVGRFHSYEGYSLKTTVFPIRVFARMGVRLLLTTNAAGGLNENFEVGDICVINDHLNLPGLVGLNPLTGLNESGFGGERFLPLSDAYDLTLRQAIFKAAKQISLTRRVHEGVYCFVSGPTYETRAECRMLKTLGADLVGMSTVPEIIVARHCGMRVLAMSLVTNKAVFTAPVSGQAGPEAVDNSRQGIANHTEVLEAGLSAAEDMKLLVVAALTASLSA